MSGGRHKRCLKDWHAVRTPLEFHHERTRRHLLDKDLPLNELEYLSASGLTHYDSPARVMHDEMRSGLRRTICGSLTAAVTSRRSTPTSPPKARSKTSRK